MQTKLKKVCSYVDKTERGCRQNWYRYVDITEIGMQTKRRDTLTKLRDKTEIEMQTKLRQVCR